MEGENTEVADGATDPSEQSTGPERDAYGRFIPKQAEADPPAEETPVARTPKKFKLANDEYELPDEVPDEVYQRVSKTASDLTGAWTRSMQEAAEVRKQAQAELQQRAAEWQASQANLDLIAEEKAIAKTVGEYDKVNWQQLQASDPNLAMQHWMQYQQLQNQLNGKRQEIESKKQEFSAKQREAFQRAAYEMNRTLSDPASGISGWGQDLHSKLVEYGLTYGYRPEELSATMDPRAFRILHKAFMADQALKAAKAAEPAPQAKPVSKVGTTAAAGRVDPDKMSTEDWLEWRNKELYGGRR